MGHWGKTNETLDRPRSTFSDVPVEWSQYRILGDPGTQRSRWVIMAVQWFFGSGITAAWDGPIGIWGLVIGHLI
jgi:hypothetical protein